MHDGCSANFENGLQILNKVRAMGFSNFPLPVALTIECQGCSGSFQMLAFETACPHCGLIHAVTPCHAFDAENVVSSGTYS